MTVSPRVGLSGYHWNQFKVIPLTSVHGAFSKIFYDVHWTAIDEAEDGLRGRGLMMSSGHERELNQLLNGKLGQ